MLLITIPQMFYEFNYQNTLTSSLSILAFIQSKNIIPWEKNTYNHHQNYWDQLKKIPPSRVNVVARGIDVVNLNPHQIHNIDLG